MKYGYCRISTQKQSLTRQIENISKSYPEAKIYQEVYTGTVINRKEWNKLKKIISPGDTIIFDSVSRMSRNAEEGIKEYFELYNQGINLIFLKEGYINTEVYKKAKEQQIEKTGNRITDILLSAIEEVLRVIAEEQIEKAFEQSEKEVQDLRQRTKEGIRVAKSKGKTIGMKLGATYTTKKEKEFSEKIKKLSKSFGGNFKDKEIIEMFNMRPATYYKYKKNIKIAMENENED